MCKQPRSRVAVTSLCLLVFFAFGPSRVLAYQQFDPAASCRARLGEIGTSIGRSNDKISAVSAERDRVLGEFRQGYFCSECNRSKSEIESPRESFTEHLKRVRGHVVPATQRQIDAKAAEFDSKLAELRRELGDHRDSADRVATDCQRREAEMQERLRQREAERRRQEYERQQSELRRQQEEVRERRQKIIDDGHARAQRAQDTARIISDGIGEVGKLIQDHMERKQREEERRSELHEQRREERELRAEQEELASRAKEMDDFHRRTMAKLEQNRANDYRETAAPTATPPAEPPAKPLLDVPLSSFLSSPVRDRGPEAPAPSSFASLFGGSSESTPAETRQDNERVVGILAGLFDEARKGNTVDPVRYAAREWLTKKLGQLADSARAEVFFGKSESELPEEFRRESAVWKAGLARVTKPFSPKAGFNLVDRFGELLDLWNKPDK